MRGYNLRLKKLAKALPRGDGRCPDCRGRVGILFLESIALAPHPPGTPLTRLNEPRPDYIVPVGDWSAADPCPACGWTPFVCEAVSVFGHDEPPTGEEP